MSNLRAAFICLSLLNASHIATAQTGTAVPAQTASACAAASIPDQKPDEDTIRRIEQGWLTAELHGDARFLECLLESDYRVSARDGKIRSRQDLIERVSHVTDASRPVPPLESIVFVHGDAAMAHSILRTTDKDGKPKEVHFVDSYAFHDGRWYAFGGADL